MIPTSSTPWPRPLRQPRALSARAGLLLILAGCWGPSRPEPTEADGPVWPLSQGATFAELEVPADSRDGQAPPERIALGPWALVGTQGEEVTWQARLPIRPRSLFFFRAPPGMQVVSASGDVLPHEKLARRGAASWSFGPQHLTLRLPQADGAPGDTDWFLSYPRALQREAVLNHAFSGVAAPEAFVQATVQAGHEARTGLLLPAPGKAAWDVMVPPAGELSFAPGIVAPEILDGRASDGATLVVEVEVEGATTELWRKRATGPDFERVRLDLSRWSGQQVRLRFRSEPGATSRFDYAFFADPVLGPRKRDPRRVVLVFVDTLRPDHLGLYGYERDTSASLDRLGANAAVFENARSVAPWTLPTGLALLTGRHPELYDVTPTLAGRLGEHGWATAMLAANVYLSANFGLARDWGLHRVELFAKADAQVDRALAWLEEQDGRDALLLLHLMDAHLPYAEPAAFRRRFAGDAPDALGETFHRPDVIRARLERDEDRQYVRDRYDNNIAFIHHELQRLLDQLDDNDVIVYLSDHGEEFWEHGGFEHGHTLYDEVLRVPLVIKAPGVSGTRVSAPVSLLDVVPTILDALDLPAHGLDGASLLPVSRGAEGAAAALDERALAFGRPLYGNARWGVLQGTRKYTTTDGRESLFDLAADAGEEHELIAISDGSAGAPHRERMGEALGRHVPVALRFVGSGARQELDHELVVEVEIPGGVAAAWIADDPTNASSAAVEVQGERVVMRWHAAHRGSREIYVLPEADVASVARELTASLALGAERATLTVDERRAEGFRPTGSALGSANVGDRRVTLTWGIAPVPGDDIEAIQGDDAELREMLQQMGYTVGGE